MGDDRQRSSKPATEAISGSGFSAPWKITPDFNFRQVSDRVWIAAILIAALVVRVLTLWELSRNYPGFYSPDVDSQWHYLWAKIIARGDWTGEGVFYRAPFYPYVLGIWIKIFGDGLWGIKLVQAVVSASSAALTCLIGWRIFGRKVGVIAGCVWAFWGPVIYYDSELLLEVLFVPLNMLAVWLTLGRMKQPSERLLPWFAIGIILGVSAVTRPNILIAIPVFWWMAWPGGLIHRLSRPELWRALRRPLILTFGLAIPILPVTVRNWWVAGDPVLIAYQGGVNLYLGNNIMADGLTMRMPETSMDPTISWNRFVIATDSIAVAQAGSPLRASEISSFWTSKALEFIRTNPGRAVEGWFKKVYYLWNGFEVGDQANIYDFRRFSVILQVLIWRWPLYFPFGLVAPLALIGLVWTWRRERLARPLAIFVALYSLSVIGFLATARHRLPMIPLLVIFAVAGTWLLFDFVRKRRTVVAWVPMVIAALLIVTLNRPTVDRIMNNPSFTAYQDGLAYDRQGNYSSSAAAYERALELEPYNLAARRNLALALVKTGRYDSAIAVSFSYLRERQTDADAMNNLGLAYLGKSDTENALASFRITTRASTKLAQPHFNMGEIATARGKTAEAREHYRNAIKADSLYGSAYNALGISYAQQGELDSAIAILGLCTRNVPEYPNAWANLGSVNLQANEPQLAIEPLRHASELNLRSVAIRFNLALAYSRSGNASEAERQLRQVLALDPNHQGAQQLLSMLTGQGAGGR